MANSDGNNYIDLESRLKHLLSLSPAVIHTFGPSGDYKATFISDSIKTLLGYEPSQFLDDPFFWLNHIYPGRLPLFFRLLVMPVPLNKIRGFNIASIIKESECFIRPNGKLTPINLIQGFNGG